MITIANGDETIPAYLAEPDVAAKGGVVLIHEVWGLTDHIKNVADRFAAEGYTVVAPNLLHQTDIERHATAQMQRDLFHPERRSIVQPKLRELTAPLQTPEFAKQTVARVRRCFDYLYEKPELGERVGIVGYCFGGTYSYSLAVQESRLRAAVPFYGHANFSIDELKNIACPILAFYGQSDENLIKVLPQLKQDMAMAGVNYRAVVYPDCGHAFFNDTNHMAYNEAAATDAWRKTLTFLAEHLDSY